MLNNPLESWDRQINSLYLSNQEFQMQQITKYPYITSVIAENNKTVFDLQNLHICRNLNFIFLQNNNINTLSQIYKKQNLIYLDISNNQLNISALLTIKSLKIDYLNIYGNQELYDELLCLENFFYQQKSSIFSEKFQAKNYPLQDGCSCKYVFDNKAAQDPLNISINPHIRLFLVKCLPFVSSLNFKLIIQQERDLAELYFSQEQVLLKMSEKMLFYMKQFQKRESQQYNIQPPSQHYFSIKSLLAEINTYEKHNIYKCFSCQRIQLQQYFDVLRFPNKEINRLLMHIMYILQISKFFQFQSLQTKLHQILFDANENKYQKMVLPISTIQPYIFAEILTINHLMQFGEIVSPQRFAQIGISIVENDCFGQFFLGFLQRQHSEKVIEKNTTLEQLYTNLILYCKYFIQAVEIDDSYSSFVYRVYEQPQNNQVRKPNVSDYIEELFWKCEGLTLNSVRYLQYQVQNKQNIVIQMAEKRQGLIELRNIDIFEDQYMEIKKYSKKHVSRYEEKNVEIPIHQQIKDLYDTETDVLKKLL